MRGKLERARQGRLPQAAGAGHYGYRYDAALGVRIVVPEQAEVVQRMFERFLVLRSHSAVAGELNGARVPAFQGGRWYPLTVRRMLTAETYRGRTYFCKTRRLRQGPYRRSGRVVERPNEEWIEVPGVTPRIVSDALWVAVQQALAEPVPARVRSAYLLSKRIDCLLCGAPMVGHTLSSKGYRTRYYRCRHSFDRNSGGSCSARYVRADALERAVLDELERREPLSPAASVLEWQRTLAVWQVHVQARRGFARIEGVTLPSGERFGRSRRSVLPTPWSVEVAL
jgi:hypothetical protein